MDSLKPRSIFPIVRGISDPSDSATYYVRAVIRNAIDNTTLATVNLINLGGRYFRYNYEVPADVSGEGFYISIVTEVYTDSGYTVRSTDYGDEFQTYLVAERPNQAQIGGAGGGADISYKKVREIVVGAINEAISGIPKPIEHQETDLSPIIDTLNKELSRIYNRIGSINIPEQIKPIDYSDKFSKIELAISEALKSFSKKPESNKELIKEIRNLSYEIRQESEKSLSMLKKLEKFAARPTKKDEIITKAAEEIVKIIKPTVWYRNAKNLIPAYRKNNAIN